jgi:hypothetical protein
MVDRSRSTLTMFATNEAPLSFSCPPARGPQVKNCGLLPYRERERELLRETYRQTGRQRGRRRCKRVYIGIAITKIIWHSMDESARSSGSGRRSNRGNHHQDEDAVVTNEPDGVGGGAVSTNSSRSGDDRRSRHKPRRSSSEHTLTASAPEEQLNLAVGELSRAMSSASVSEELTGSPTGLLSHRTRDTRGTQGTMDTGKSKGTHGTGRTRKTLASQPTEPEPGLLVYSRKGGANQASTSILTW